MKAFFRVVISLVLCAVLAVCIAAYEITTTVSDFLTEENIRGYVEKHDLSDAFAEAVGQYAGGYIDELGENVILRMLFGDGLDEAADGFLHSEEFRELANESAQDYAAGFVRYFRTGEGSWEPDEASLLDLAEPLASQLASQMTIRVPGVTESWLAEIIRAGIGDTFIPEIERSVPTYEELLGASGLSARAAIFRRALELMDTGVFMYAGAAAAALLVLVSILLPKKGRRVLCTGWLGLGLLAGGGAIWGVGRSFADIGRLRGALEGGVFEGLSELAGEISGDLSSAVTAAARPYLIAGAALLAVFLLLAAVLPRKKKMPIRQY